jgi:hypothetical protein
LTWKRRWSLPVTSLRRILPGCITLLRSSSSPPV